MSIAPNSASGRKALTTMLAMVACLLAANLWLSAVGSTPALAQGEPTFGNTGAQREQMVAMQKETNRKLDELIALLKSGDAKFQLAQPGKDKDRPGDAATKKTTP